MTWKMVIPCLVAVVVACGGGGGDGTDGDTATDTEAEVEPDTGPEVEPDTEPDTPSDPVEEWDPAVCESFAVGLNSGFMVDGTAREFYLDLPAGVDTDGPWPVVFNWHGMGDTSVNMRNLLSGEVDSTVMPFILVTPEDTGFTILGLPVDWYIHIVDESNMEIRLFDEVLACLDHLWGVDPDHVHSVGFSMGGFVADALGTVRGEVVGSLVTFSGAYGCNEANTSSSMLGGIVDWPEHSVANTYAQLLAHGGTADTYDIMLDVLHFDDYSRNDAAFLNDRGHDVVICDHGGGHTVPADLRGPAIVRFFADHPLGTRDSPYASGLPAELPTYCTFQGAP